MLFHENKITHRVRLGSEMCVFDFWAWRSTFPEPTVENGACECFLTKRVRLVQVPAAFDPSPREHSFHLSQGRWTEQKVEGGRFQEGDGFALNETWQWWWWGGGRGGRVGFMWEGQSPECKTTVHASFKQAHAPFKYKKNTLCNVECGTRAWTSLYKVTTSSFCRRKIGIWKIFTLIGRNLLLETKSPLQFCKQ